MADRATSASASPSSNDPPLAFASGGTALAGGAAAAADATQGSIDIDGVSKALEWWEKKAVDVDEERHRLTVEGQR